MPIPGPMQCPACYTPMTHSMPRPVEPATPDAPATTLARLRGYYALPHKRGPEDLAAEGALDSWSCGRCQFKWEAMDGPLDQAVTIAMLGFTAAGKSTYIASLGQPAPGENLLAQTRAGRTWSNISFEEFWRSGRILQQTMMLDGPGLFVATSPATEASGAGADGAGGREPEASPAREVPEPGVAGDAGAEEHDVVDSFGDEAQSEAAQDPGPVSAETSGSLPFRVFQLVERIRWSRTPVISTALLMDMPGEALAPDQDLPSLLNQAPSLAVAPLVIFCLDPTQLDGLQPMLSGEELAGHVDSPASAVAYRLGQLAGLRRNILGPRSHGHVAIVILKADLLAGLDNFPAKALEHFPRTEPGPTWRRLQEDSERVREWLLDGVAPGVVTVAEESFSSRSYHVVSATGCSPETGPRGQKAYPRIAPMRVLDPIQYYYLKQFGGANA